MTNPRQNLFSLLLLLAVAAGGMFAAQRPAAPAPPRTLAQVLERIETNAGRFRRSLDQAGAPHWTACQRDNDALDDCVSQLIAATRRLRGEIGRGPRLAIGIEDILRLGGRIDAFSRRRQLPMRAERDWLMLRGDLEELARVSGTPWEWSPLRHADASVPRHDWAQPSPHRK